MAKSSNNRLRTVATFASAAFKGVDEADDKPRFRGTVGDDVAIWLMLELEHKAVDVTPGLNQADFGWHFTIRTENREHVVLVCLHDMEGPTWRVSIERDITGLGAWFGGRRRSVRPRAAMSIHAVLSKSDKVRSVRWHHEHDLKAGNGQKGGLEPLPSPG